MASQSRYVSLFLRQPCYSNINEGNPRSALPLRAVLRPAMPCQGWQDMDQLHTSGSLVIPMLSLCCQHA